MSNTKKDLEHWMKFGSKNGDAMPEHVKKYLQELKQGRAASNALLTGEASQAIKQIEQEQTPEGFAEKLAWEKQVEDYEKLNEGLDSVFNLAAKGLDQIFKKY